MILNTKYIFQSIIVAIISSGRKISYDLQQEHTHHHISNIVRLKMSGRHNINTAITMLLKAVVN